MKEIHELRKKIKGKLNQKNDEGYFLMFQEKSDSENVDIVCESESTPEIMCNMIGNVMERNQKMRAVLILSVFSFIAQYDENELGFLDSHIEILQSLKI